MKAISEAPKIAEGLTTIRKAMKKAFKKRVREVAPDATGVQLTMEPVQVATGWGAMLADAQIQGCMVSITLRAAGSPLPKGIVSFLDGQFVRVRAKGGDVVALLDDISAIEFDDTSLGGPARDMPPGAASDDPTAPLPDDVVQARPCDLSLGQGKVDGNCYEIYGRNKAGKKVKIYYDAKTLEPVKIELEK